MDVRGTECLHASCLLSKEATLQAWRAAVDTAARIGRPGIAVPSTQRRRDGARGMRTATQRNSRPPNVTRNKLRPLEGVRLCGGE